MKCQSCHLSFVCLSVLSFVFCGREQLTCELQRAAQRALGRSQQGQTGVFGVRVLQTLHQRDGRVLHKLHQQLRGGAK